ncbi:MAG: DNA polymerase III subunit alpha [Kurthia sp.]|nr:DNA polymerase III subunit alpha [Candidatus Kurthia equi]
MNAHYPQIITSASMLDSIVKIEELSAMLQQYEHATVAITDPKLYGLLQFYKEMKQHNIQPVLALTVQIPVTDELKMPLVLYAQNNIGYHHLLKITSAISLRPERDLPIKWLAGYRDGLLAMIPTAGLGEVGLYRALIEQVAQQFERMLYIGMERMSAESYPQEFEWQQLAQELSIELMATQKVTFLNPQDEAAFEAALAIQQGVRIEDREPLSIAQRSQYLPTMQQMQERFHDQPQWLANTEKLLDSCHVELEYTKHFMPKFDAQSAGPSSELLIENCRKGMKFRGIDGQVVYEERLNYELSVIHEMGYDDYFLIVADYIQYARNNRILTGPGRGSSASSLVAYCLQITNVDPIKYDLLFERFLNPERITLPDIDVDFADAKRQQIIKYVAEKYGSKFTSQIITFGTLSAKAVARDVARVLGFTTEEMGQISNLIPSKPGMTLQQALPALENWVGTDEERKKWLAIALKLEGLKRNASTHAAGVVLSPIPLVDIVPIEKSGEDLFITQWPMKEIEEVGLLKMDFLGLRNLSILDHIRSLIYFNEKRMLDFEKIPLQNERTFQLLQQGDTTGVFQLESSGMRQALRDIRPTTFLDIVAINALYRPGPMDFIPVYSRRKHGQEPVVIPHPALESILNETFGVIIYQEQIMKIASVFAGFSFGEADLLRRAVSKKKKELLDAERTHFVQGAIKKGHDEHKANEIYDLIVRFANYGFPKSHAVAYSLITYQMAYLKANFAPYFYAALLTSVLGDKEKQLQILQEAKAKGIEILPPSISKSGKGYRIEEGKIRLALGGIKGVSQTFLKKLQQLRAADKSEWENIFMMALDFTASHFKRSSIEPLIKAGALDELNRPRAVLLETITRAEKLAKIYAPDEQTSLFYDTAVFGVPKHAEAEIEDEMVKLQDEKEVLGFYISTHPIEKLKQRLSISSTPLVEVSSIKMGDFVKVAAMVRHIKKIRTKKGEQMAFLDLEDETGTLSATIFPMTFEQISSWIEEQPFIQAEGKIEYRQNKVQLIIKKIEAVQPT